MKRQHPFVKIIGGLVAACFVAVISIVAFSVTSDREPTVSEQANPTQKIEEKAKKPKPSKTLSEMATDGANAKPTKKLSASEQKAYFEAKLSKYPRLDKYKTSESLDTSAVLGDEYADVELQAFIAWRNDVYFEKLNEYVVLLEEQRELPASTEQAVPTDPEEKFLAYTEKETEYLAYLDASELVSSSGAEADQLREDISNHLGSQMKALQDKAFDVFYDQALSDKAYLIDKITNNLGGATDARRWTIESGLDTPAALKEIATYDKIIAGGQAILDKLNALPDNDASSVVAEYRAWDETDWWGDNG